MLNLVIKRTLIGTVLLLLLVSFFVAGSTIELQIGNLDSQRGQLVIGLYDKGGSFPETGREVRGLKLKLDSAKPKATFSSVPPGKYAISLFHDLNGNDKLDKNFMGIPKEKYGFSKNVFNWYGAAPEFNRASFELERGEKISLVINVMSWPPV